MASKRKHPEDDIQRKVAKWLDGLGVLYFHPPNGGKRGKAAAGIFKALGVKPGVPDLIIMEPHGETCPHCGRRDFGTGIELKAPGGYPNPNQRKWLADLKARRWITGVARSLEEVKAHFTCLPIDHG